MLAAGISWYISDQAREDFPWHQDNGYNYVQPQPVFDMLDRTYRRDNRQRLSMDSTPGQHVNGTLHHDWTSIGFQCLAEHPQDALPLEVKAGSVAVFSSLTPRTGPNLTQGIRKTYILQYAPDGAMIHPRVGAAQPANDHSGKFLVT